MTTYSNTTYIISNSQIGSATYLKQRNFKLKINEINRHNFDIPKSTIDTNNDKNRVIKTDIPGVNVF